MQRATELRRATADDYAKWVALYEWDHLGSVTFRPAVSEETAVVEFRKWIRRLEQRAKRRVCWCYALERHQSGQYHLHCLVYAGAVLTSREAQAAWRDGHSRIVRFRVDVRGPEYVLKSLVQANTEYDFSKHFPPRRVPVAA